MFDTIDENGVELKERVAEADVKIDAGILAYAGFNNDGQVNGNIAEEFIQQKLGKNLFWNGNLDYWQRSLNRADLTQFNSTNTYLTAQRSDVNTSLLPGINYAYKINSTRTNILSSMNDYASLKVFAPECVKQYCTGEKVTVSFYVKSSINKRRIGVALTQHYKYIPDILADNTTKLAQLEGASGPSLLDGGEIFELKKNQWQRIEYTVDTYPCHTQNFGTGDPRDALVLEIFFAWQSSYANLYFDGERNSSFSAGTLEITGFQLEIGEGASKYRPYNKIEILPIIQRYCEKNVLETDLTLYPVEEPDVYKIYQATCTEVRFFEGNWMTPWIGTDRPVLYINVPFRVEKRAAPTSAYGGSLQVVGTGVGGGQIPNAFFDLYHQSNGWYQSWDSRSGFADGITNYSKMGFTVQTVGQGYVGLPESGNTPEFTFGQSALCSIAWQYTDDYF